MCISINVNNFVRCQKQNYFGHVTRHRGLEKTVTQGMVAGNRNRKTKIKMGEGQARGIAGDRYQFRKKIWEVQCSLLDSRSKT